MMTIFGLEILKKRKEKKLWKWKEKKALKMTSQTGHFQSFFFLRPPPPPHPKSEKNSINN